MIQRKYPRHIVDTFLERDEKSNNKAGSAFCDCFVGIRLPAFDFDSRNRVTATLSNKTESESTNAARPVFKVFS